MSSTFTIQFQSPKKNRVRNVKKSVLGQKCQRRLYSENGNKISFTFPLYTRETQISFFVPELAVLFIKFSLCNFLCNVGFLRALQ
jgi:hypothetical protein